MIKFRWETEFQKTEIGEIPQDWEVKVLSHILKVKSGKYFRFSEFTNSGVKCLKIDNVGFGEIIWDSISFLPTDYLKKYPSFVLNVGDIVMALNRPIIDNQLKIGIIKDEDSPSILYQRVGKLIFNNAYSSKYFFYVFKTRYFIINLLSLLSGTDQPYITKYTFSNMLTPIPSEEEQARIAAVLSWFDDLIENKKRQNEILENTAMALFKSWFVDFEPFRGEKFVYSEELDREIPEGWEVKPIGEVAEFVKGLSYRSDELADSETEGKIFITLKIFKRGGGFRPEFKYYKGSRYSQEQITADGDLVIALTDMTPDAKVVGAPALVILPPSRNTGVLSLDAAKLNMVEHIKEFLYLYLKDTQEENATFANGANVLHLSLDRFKMGKYVLVPPEPVLRKFHEMVEPLFRKIINNQKEIMVLKKVRDALLPLLVFGKLRVMEI